LKSLLYGSLQSLQHENQRLLAIKLASGKQLDAAIRAKEGLQAELAAARKVRLRWLCPCHQQSMSFKENGHADEKHAVALHDQEAVATLPPPPVCVVACVCEPLGQRDYNSLPTPTLPLYRSTLSPSGSTSPRLQSWSSASSA